MCPLGLKINNPPFRGGDLKRHTSEKLHAAILAHPHESRREWMLWMMERAAAKTSKSAKFQLWQLESHPVEIRIGKVAHQKLAYIHNNPVAAGFVKNPCNWKYSSAVDYNGGKGLIDLIYVEPMIISI